MAKLKYIELPGELRVPILYEDRAVLAIDKPRGWLLAPSSWQQTARNLQSALETGIREGHFWAKSRNLRFLRFVHRLEAETSGVLLLVKSPGAVKTYSELFESRQIEKVYLAVVRGAPKQAAWVCRLALAPDTATPGKSRADPKSGKAAETDFHVLAVREGTALVEVRPLTGRTHQIRVHLAESGLPVVGDSLYGEPGDAAPLALRAVRLAFTDPFSGKRVVVRANAEAFLREYGFAASKTEEHAK